MAHILHPNHEEGFPISAPFEPSSRGPYFTQNFGNPQPRLSNTMGAISEKHGATAIFLKTEIIAGDVTMREDPYFET